MNRQPTSFEVSSCVPVASALSLRSLTRFITAPSEYLLDQRCVIGRLNAVVHLQPVTSAAADLQGFSINLRILF